MQTSKEDAFNVMILTLLIAVAVVLFSLAILQFLTGDPYLNAYFMLETFFNVHNTAASNELANIAFSQNPGSFLPILLVVIVDNLSRILVVSFIIAAVIDFLNYANVEGIINDLKAHALKGHVIVCGYSEMSSRLIKMLKEQHRPYVVVEPRIGLDLELNEQKILNLNGDFTKEEVLNRAGIENATAIIFASDSDVDNVVGSIVARRLNKKIKILSRLVDESIRKRVYGIGMDMAVIPEHLAGIEIGEYIARVRGV